MSSGFTLLWSKILESSLWVQESKETRLVWITMLAMKGSDGIVQASLVGLADRAKVSVEECRKALKVLLSPDPHDTSKVEEGRRIREVPGGWQIINNDLYRFSTEAKREFWRSQKADQRAAAAAKAAQAANWVKPKESRKARKLRLDEDARQAAFLKAEEVGNQELADRIAAGEA